MGAMQRVMRSTATPSSPSSDPPAGATVVVRVTARSAHDRVEGWREEYLVVRTTAPPLEGRANEAVRRLIARAVGVAPSRVQVIRGERAREKTVRVSGLLRDDLLRRLRHPDYG